MRIKEIGQAEVELDVEVDLSLVELSLFLDSLVLDSLVLDSVVLDSVFFGSLFDSDESDFEPPSLFESPFACPLRA